MLYSKYLQGQPLLVKNFIICPCIQHIDLNYSRGPDSIYRSHSSITACRLPVLDTLCCELTCSVSQRELIFLLAHTNLPSSKEILTTIRLSHLTELPVHMQKGQKTLVQLQLPTWSQMYSVVKLYGADSVS